MRRPAESQAWRLPWEVQTGPHPSIPVVSGVGCPSSKPQLSISTNQGARDEGPLDPPLAWGLAQ